MFKERTRVPVRDADDATALTAEQALARLLRSRSLRAHTVRRNWEIGPFVVDYVFSEASLVVELRSSAELADRNVRLRDDFLGDMGYRVVRVPRHEVLAAPRRVLARIKAALPEHRR